MITTIDRETLQLYYDQDSGEYRTIYTNQKTGDIEASVAKLSESLEELAFLLRSYDL